MNFTKLDNSQLLEFCNKLIKNRVYPSLNNAEYISNILREVRYRIDDGIYSQNNLNNKLNIVHFELSKLLASIQLDSKPNLTNI